jgi:integrase
MLTAGLIDQRRYNPGGLRHPVWLTIENNRVSANGKAVEDKPKSEESERTLPMTPTLKAVLSKARKAQVAERLALGEAYGPGTHVVCNEAGYSYHPDTLSDYWDKVTRKAGVRRIRLHDARHTCGTTMHMQGVPIVIIAAWLGHADPSFTLRTYIHAQNDALALAASSLEAVVTNRDNGGSGGKQKAKRRSGKSAG